MPQVASPLLPYVVGVLVLTHAVVSQVVSRGAKGGFPQAREV